MALGGIVMTNYTSSNLAENLGRKLGVALRFWLRDQNPTLRWLKRGLLGGALAGCALSIELNFVQMLTTLAVLCVLAGAFVRSPSPDPSSDEGRSVFSHNPNIPRDGPAGFGYYDGYGNFRGCSDPTDVD